MTQHRLSRSLILALGLLSAFGPLSMDLYLPGIPGLTSELLIDDALAQATLSASMLGLALGQLLLGPLSDRYGRRIPMLIGVGVFTVMSIACAFAPNITVLLTARFVQGVGGSSGIVISRAIIRDLTEGVAAARAFALMASILGIAPVIAPLLGGALLLVTDWRGLFFALAVVGLALLLLVWLQIPDTLAPEHRNRAGLRGLARESATIVRNGEFRVMAFVLAAGSTGLFGYVSMSTIVFQQQFEFSEQQFSLVFALNAVGIMLGSFLSRALVGRHRIGTLAVACLTIATSASGILLILTLVGAPLWAQLIPLFFGVSMHGGMLANVTALAMSSVSRAVGTASALLGAFQLGVSAFVPPLASLGGVSMAVMATTMFSGMALALVTLVVALRRRSRN